MSPQFLTDSSLLCIQKLLDSMLPNFFHSSLVLAIEVDMYWRRWLLLGCSLTSGELSEKNLFMNQAVEVLFL